MIEPPTGPRSNVEVINALALRLGCEQPAFRMTARELVDETLKASYRGSYDELVTEKWIDCQIPFEEAHYRNGFAWPDKKFRFKPDWAGVAPTDDATKFLHCYNFIEYLKCRTVRHGAISSMPQLSNNLQEERILRAKAHKCAVLT